MPYRCPSGHCIPSYKNIMAMDHSMFDDDKIKILVVQTMSSLSLSTQRLSSSRRLARDTRNFSVTKASSQRSSSCSQRRQLLAAAPSLAILSLFGGAANAADPDFGAQSIYDLSASLNGQEFSFSQFRGKVLAIVNVASE